MLQRLGQRCAARSLQQQRSSSHILCARPRIWTAQPIAKHLHCPHLQARVSTKPRTVTKADSNPGSTDSDDEDEDEELQWGSALVETGFAGTFALLLDWLLHVDVLAQFRWSLDDVRTAVGWSLPALAALLLVCLPQWGPPLDGSERAHMGNTYDRLRRTILTIKLRATANSNNASLDQPTLAGGGLSWSTVEGALSLLQAYWLELWRPYPEDKGLEGVPGFVARKTLEAIANEMLLRGVLFMVVAGFIFDRFEYASLSPGSLFQFGRIFGVMSHQTSMWLTAALFVGVSLPVLLAKEVSQARQFVRVRTLAPLFRQAAAEAIGELAAEEEATESGSSDSSSSSSESGREQSIGPNDAATSSSGSSNGGGDGVGSASSSSSSSSSTFKESVQEQLSKESASTAAALEEFARALGVTVVADQETAASSSSQDGPVVGQSAAVAEKLMKQALVEAILGQHSQMDQATAEGIALELAAEEAMHRDLLRQQTLEDKVAGWIMLLVYGSAEVATNCSFAATGNLTAAVTASFLATIVSNVMVESISTWKRRQLTPAASADV